MNVISVDTRQIHVAQRLIQLMRQIAWRHAVRSAGNVTEARDSGLHEVILDVLPHIERRPTIER